MIIGVPQGFRCMITGVPQGFLGLYDDWSTNKVFVVGMTEIYALPLTANQFIEMSISEERKLKYLNLHCTFRSKDREVCETC